MGGALPTELVGWAAITELGQAGTFGGQDGGEVTVTTAAEFSDAVAATEPLIVRLDGQIEGRFSVGSNKTLIGEAGAVLSGGLRIENVQNVIVQNLTIVGFNCTDAPLCEDGADAITVRGAHHVWFDHLDISDGSDGNLDISEAADFVTVSFTKFSYSNPARDHRFANLIGGADDNPIDEGRLNVTWHHNWWADNVDQRMPRVRYGKVHLYNNLYAAEGNQSGIRAGFQASVLLEGNVFLGTNRPHFLDDTGNLLASANLYQEATGTQDTTGIAFDPPYEYELETTDGLEAAIRANAGVR